MKSKSTNMTGQLLFTEEWAGEHPGPTNFRHFALMLFGKLTQHLECLLVQFLA